MQAAQMGACAPADVHSVMRHVAIATGSLNAAAVTVWKACAGCCCLDIGSLVLDGDQCTLLP
jgi:hypothetical protein